MTHLWSSSAQANPSHACFAARPTAALQTCVCSGGTSRSGIARRGRSAAWRGGKLGIVGGKRSEEDTSELQSLAYFVCRLLLLKKKKKKTQRLTTSLRKT